MSNYLPRTQKKHEIQQKQENKLRRMVEKGASLAKLVDAAEVVAQQESGRSMPGEKTAAFWVAPFGLTKQSGCCENCQSNPSFTNLASSSTSSVVSASCRRPYLPILDLFRSCWLPAGVSTALQSAS